MEITIYAKKRTTKEGKTFYNYLSRLNKKDGTYKVVSVKFRDSCGAPKPEKCPCNIKFDKKDGNLSERHYVNNDTGEMGINATLWLSNWVEGTPYIDNSLDDFE